MALSNRDREDIRDWILQAVSATVAERPSSPVQRVHQGISTAELRLLTEHGHMLIKPGAVRSHYLYAFLLNDDGNVFARLRVPKRVMREVLLDAVDEGGRDLIEDASVELVGEFPVTRLQSPR